MMIESLIANLQRKALVTKPFLSGKMEEYRWLLTGRKKSVYQNVLGKMKEGTEELSLLEIKVLIENDAWAEAYQHLSRKVMIGQNGHRLANQNEVWPLLAKCCYELGKLGEALENIECALTRDRPTADLWNIKANIHFERDEEGEAIECLNKAIRAFPQHIEANLRLGSLYFTKGDYQEAYHCFCGCCRIRPFDSYCWEMKAETLLKLNHIDYAGKCFAKAIRCGGSIELLARNSYCLAQSGKVNKAIRLYRKVLKYEPHNYDVLCNLAGILSNHNKIEEAYSLLKKAYLLNNHDYIMLNNLGFILYHMGRFRKAIDYYRSALNMSPDDQTILYNLSVCLVKRAMWDEAIVHLNKILDVNPNNGGAWMLLGNVYDNMEKHSIAVDCYNASYGLA
ncbi:tetratricopeptide repeat protein [Syntrophobotulus glycolicus]|nr:tetratricopeptide repeat protein [Syntrophobotulus glycolicus]